MYSTDVARFIYEGVPFSLEPVVADEHDLEMTQDDIERFVFDGVEYKLPHEMDFETFDFGTEISTFLNDYVSSHRNQGRVIRLLSINPCAVDWLLENPSYISWPEFSGNIHPAAVKYMLQRPYNINWSWWSNNCNPLAVEYLMQNLDKLDVKWFCSNSSPRAVHYLEQLVRMDHPDIDWSQVSKNVSAGHILAKNPARVVWKMASKNPGAIELIKEELKSAYPKVVFEYLSSNNHPDAIEILKQNTHKIVYRRLSGNSSALSLIKDSAVDIKWSWLSGNPAAIKTIAKHRNSAYRAGVYEYCYWKPYDDRFAIGRTCAIDLEFQKEVCYTPVVPLDPSQSSLSHRHYVYIGVMMKHERLESDLLRKYQCRTGVDLTQRMMKLIDLGCDETKIQFERYQSLKSMRSIIAHAKSMQSLESSKSLEHTRQEFVNVGRDLLDVATRAIRTIIQYERTIANAISSSPALFHASHVSFVDVLDWSYSQNQDDREIERLRELHAKRNKIAHAHEWSQLMYI